LAPSTGAVFEKTKVDTAVRYALPSSDVQSEIDNTLIKETLMSIVSEKTGYPEEMLEPEMDMEADLGIDSIKRVEILGALQDQVPALPELDADDLTELRTLAQIINYVERCEVKEKPLLKPQTEMTPSLQPAGKTPQLAPFHAPEVREIKTTLMSIVSEKTGYPVDMLELDMDMEADLGIDSIKRVEILGALQDQVPNIQEIDADALTELRTLRHIIGYIDQQESKEKKV
jgi:acyl carrier protein